MRVINSSAGIVPPVCTKYTIRAKDTKTATKLSLWRCGNIIGLDENVPRNLPKATIEPVKVTAPMKMPRKTSTKWMLSIAPVRCSLLAALATSLRASFTAARVALISPPTATTTCDTSCGCKSIKLLKPTNTAAIPTKLCNIATNSGI